MALPTIVNPSKFLADHIRQIHNALHSHALRGEMHETPRTTIVAAIAQHGWLYCAHVGDSRLYHFRDGSLLYRTEDHSKVQMMFRNGEITADEMLKHPERSVLYNCLGGDAEPQVGLSHRRVLANGDTVLLCSDGLWSMLTDHEFADMLRQENVIQAVPKLLDLAESRCGKSGDNTSVVAFNWGGQAGGHLSISTATMPLKHTTTIHNSTPGGQADMGAGNGSSLSEEEEEMEIDKAIAEIQAALEKIPK
jgi:serine/threonine protein phosphatase PrpC